MAKVATSPIYEALSTDIDWGDPKLDNETQLDNYYADVISLTGLTRSHTIPDPKKAYSDRIKDYKEVSSSLYDNLLKTIIWKDSALENLYEIYKECSEVDWDGYDANPISQEVYLEASKLIRILPSSIPMPEILPEPDGHIGFEWYKGENYVFVISLEGNNVIDYAGLFGKNNDTQGRVYFSDSVPNVIIENISQLFAPSA